MRPFWEISERDHDIQNPTSPEKIRLLGERLRLGPESRVLDIASGRGGPAIVLASTFGCRIVAVERSRVFAAAARERIAAASLDHLVEVHERDAVDFPLEREAWDAALCLGATFVWGNAADAVAALTPAVRSRGHVAVGEPYWRQWPLPSGVADQGSVGFAETLERFETGLRTTAVIAASEDDWDRYETLHWHAVEEWLVERPGDPERDEIRRRHEEHRTAYVEHGRALLGWAIFVGLKR